MQVDWLVVGVFAVVYAGMALGRWPGLAIDRTGVALIGAIVLFVSGVVDARAALDAIDFPTLTVLFALMVISAQFAASGFFDWLGRAVSRGQASPQALLFRIVAAGGVLAAFLTNDVVVWALTPILVQGLLRRGLDPRPYVIGLVCAANAGSAATVIGNPQNLLISQYGGLHIGPFLLACGVPAVLSLAIVYGTIVRTRFFTRESLVDRPSDGTGEGGRLKKGALLKALAATVAIIVVFAVAEDRATWALAIAGSLLLSRTLATRQMLSMVDWHLLLLFGGLFVVTGALSVHPSAVPAALAGAIAGGSSANVTLGAVALAGSNTIGNVPLVVFLLSLDGGWSESALYALALFSTLAGNFLIVGSVANIIAVERARSLGVIIGFLDYAKIGVPVTLLSLIIGYVWLGWAYPTAVRLAGG